MTSRGHLVMSEDIFGWTVLNVVTGQEGVSDI